MKQNRILVNEYNPSYYLCKVTAPKERAAILANNRYDGRTLADCYGTYGRRKESAYNYCRALCYSFGGHDLRICSHNVRIFCVKFEFTHPETGALCTAYITPAHNKFVEH
jgi:hypothetical protein